MRHASGRVRDRDRAPPRDGGLFAMRRKPGDPIAPHFEVALDSSEPYLNDHRPHGVPFLGTVMGLEALAGAVHRVSPGLGVARIEDVRVEIPCPVAERTRRTVGIRVAPSHQSPASVFNCSLDSESLERRVIHFAARIVLALALSPRERAPRVVVTEPTSAAVPGLLVYRHFFHGPCFQVVGSAEWRNDTMRCR